MYWALKKSQNNMSIVLVVYLVWLFIFEAVNMIMGSFKNGLTYKRKQRAAENVTVVDSVMREFEET